MGAKRGSLQRRLPPPAHELDETIDLVLSNVTGGATLGTDEATVTIEGPNDQVAGTIAFDPASYSVAESCGTVGVTVTRTGGSDGAVSVDYADALTGTATSGSDYTAITGDTLDWANGDLLLTAAGDSWDDPQTVTVAAVDDDVAEGAHHGIIKHSVESEDEVYDGIETDDVTVDITDNDTASVIVRPLTVNVAEGGAPDTYQIYLATESTGTVTITIDPDSQVRVDPTVLYFSPDLSELTALVTEGTDWDRPRIVTVTAVDDSVVEGPRHGHITHSASGGGFDGAEIASVLANITDNDREVPPHEEKVCCSPHWFYADLMREIKNGVVRTSDGPAFRPNAPITREEAAVMIARALIHCGRPEVISDLLARQILARFRDARQIGDDNLRTVALAVYTEMMIGRTPGTFMPNASLSRAEVAQALARLWRSLRAH